MDLRFCPSEGSSGLVVGLDECIDVAGELVNAGEAGAAEGLAGQDREPALDLIEPRGMGWCEMKVDLRMLSQPSIFFGFVRVKVIQNDVDFPFRIVRHDLIHKIQELHPSASPIMARLNPTGGHVQRGKKRAGPATLVFVIKTAQSASIGQFEPPLRPC